MPAMRFSLMRWLAVEAMQINSKHRGRAHPQQYSGKHLAQAACQSDVYCLTE